ncbi:hypothetical protein F4778DRAFT_785404 [Xylariomycetidae sp. FL2044]|nr:hypothetical protein F4778DRAFT_785404 [Xylariomycetidae sp. FL2044]
MHEKEPFDFQRCFDTLPTVMDGAGMKEEDFASALYQSLDSVLRQQDINTVTLEWLHFTVMCDAFSRANLPHAVSWITDYHLEPPRTYHYLQGPKSPWSLENLQSLAKYRVVTGSSLDQFRDNFANGGMSFGVPTTTTTTTTTSSSSPGPNPYERQGPLRQQGPEYTPSPSSSSQPRQSYSATMGRTTSGTDNAPARMTELPYQIVQRRQGPQRATQLPKQGIKLETLFHASAIPEPFADGCQPWEVKLPFGFQYDRDIKPFSQSLTAAYPQLRIEHQGGKIIITQWLSDHGAQQAAHDLAATEQLFALANTLRLYFSKCLNDNSVYSLSDAIMAIQMQSARRRWEDARDLFAPLLDSATADHPRGVTNNMPVNLGDEEWRDDYPGNINRRRDKPVKNKANYRANLHPPRSEPTRPTETAYDFFRSIPRRTTAAPQNTQEAAI